ncbi:MAG: outer membrane protein assembly factor BamD [bacterium]|nr:outer membrane protein assembly factor BamD [bacterium]
MSTRQKSLIRFLYCLFFIGISGNIQSQEVTPSVDDKALYERAETTFKSGNFDEANGLYQKYLDLYPQGDKIPDVRLRLAECSFQQRDFAKAAILYEKVADLYPGLEMAKFALSRAGESFQKTGDYANAKKIFTKLKDRYPDTPDAEYAKYNLTNLEKYIPSPKPATPTTTGEKGREKPKTASIEPTEDELLQKAKESFEAKNYQQSISLFKDFLKRFPKSSFAHYAQLKIAESLYYQEKFKEALKEYKKVIADYPESKHVDYTLYSIGWCNYRTGNDNEAISSFEKLIKGYPNSKYVASSQKAIEKIKLEYNEKKAKELLSTAKSFYAAQKNREAKNTLNELLEKYPENEWVNEAKELLTKIDEQLIAGSYKKASTIYERGETALKDKNYDEAIHEFKRVILEFPESEYAKLAIKSMALIEEEKAYLLAKAKWEDSVKLYEEQKLDRAKEGFKEIVKEYPQTKYKEEAEEKLIELETKEDELGAYNTYKKALSLQQEKDYLEAINTFQKILTDYPNTEYVSLAQAGIASAQEAMKNDRVRRKFDIARRYYELGDYKSAKGWFEDIKENYPDTEYAREANENLVTISKMGTSKGVEEEYNLGIKFYEQGKLQEAITYFKKVVDNYPKTKFAKAAQESLIIATNKLKDEQAKILYDGARKFQGYGKYKFAMEQYDKLINDYPNSYWTVYALYGKAEILYGLEDFNQAKILWQRVAVEFPASDLVPHALYHVAECCEQQGDYKKACSSYERLQKTYPNSIYAQGELAELIKDKIVTLKGVR